MSTLIIRILLSAAVIMGTWYAAKLGLAYRLALQAQECTPEIDRANIANEHVGEVAQLRITAKTFVCVANNQNAIDRMYFDARKYFDAPEKWPFPIDEYRQQIRR